MRQAIGITHLTYSAECPYCGVKTYSAIHSKQWSKLEYDEGKPFGFIKCVSCDNDFELTIGDEIL